MMATISSLRIRGFRSFGSDEQVLDLSPELTVIWAPNSQGKTSVAEAIEFMLSGRTSRKQLIGSAAREFADSLKNVHLSESEPVKVSATIVGNDGSEFDVERELTADYAARSDCQSKLTIDGSEVSSISDIGIHLSEPPLETPILLQHNLRFVLSARPQDRANYFKAILEISDLETFRDAVYRAGESVPIPDTPLLQQMRAALEELGSGMEELKGTGGPKAKVTSVLGKGLRAILGPGHETTDLPALVAEGRKELESRREAAFPLGALQPRGELPTLPDIPALESGLARLVDIRSAATEASDAVLRLYEAYSALSETGELEPPPRDCPLCLTPDALSEERHEAIQAVLRDTSEARRETHDLERMLVEQRRAVTDLIMRTTTQVLPEIVGWDAAERAKRSVDLAALSVLVASGEAEVLDEWSTAEQALVEEWNAARQEVEAVAETLSELTLSDLGEGVPDQVSVKYSSLSRVWQRLEERLKQYADASRKLRDHVIPLLDQRTRIRGLRDMVDLGERSDAIAHELQREQQTGELRNAIEEAVREIDQAKTHVLDEKFDELADEVSRWWSLLRPEELSFFAGVQRAGTGRRFIDLKAGLAIDEQRSGAKERDAVAVFSDSQLNCLGLSAFLARVSRNPVGMVLLDDPIQGSDTEHRASFLETVPETLLAEGQQLVILTHDERLSTNLQERYSHREVRAFSVLIDDPSEGAKFEQTRDTFDELLARAAPLRRRDELFSRKQVSGLLRDAAERFCKLLLVAEARSQGQTAHLYDYDGQMLGSLVPSVEHLLNFDPSHPGKLRTVESTTNPGNHDDTAASSPELRAAYGDLRKLGQRYL